MKEFEEPESSLLAIVALVAILLVLAVGGIWLVIKLENERKKVTEDFGYKASQLLVIGDYKTVTSVSFRVKGYFRNRCFFARKTKEDPNWTLLERTCDSLVEQDINDIDLETLSASP